MSDYFTKLNSENKDVADQYLQKISIINKVDPF